MVSKSAKLNVLFLCTGNSCRSQMAEGFARAMGNIEAYSAGTHPKGVDPRAVLVMREVGVEIGDQRSKRPEEVEGVEFDLIVTVCDAAREACPVMPGASTIHHGFDDPPRLAQGEASEDAALRHYRRVRDEIREFVGGLTRSEGLRVDARCDWSKESAMSEATKTNGKGPCCVPGCCGAVSEGADVREQVRAGYAAIAKVGSWSAANIGAGAPVSPSAFGCCGPTASKGGGGCCGGTTLSPEQLAAAIGYSEADLGGVPDDANMGLSCGNPTALASLKPGEVVLDLGSGGGFDAFVAGPKVGKSGRVIGVDMTPEMLGKARANLAGYRAQTGLDNVEFRLGEIENLPVADASVDVVISNCVLNLSPDQERVWREIARVLKPGGRVAVSDLVLLRALPEVVRKDVEALVGCVAGATLMPIVEGMARRAGLQDVRVERKGGYVDAMVDSDDPLYRKIIAALGPHERIGDFVTSADISAVKA